MRKVPFILLTGRGDRELVVKAAEAGVNNFGQAVYGGDPARKNRAGYGQTGVLAAASRGEVYNLRKDPVQVEESEDDVGAFLAVFAALLLDNTLSLDETVSRVTDLVMASGQAEPI